MSFDTKFAYVDPSVAEKSAPRVDRVLERELQWAGRPERMIRQEMEAAVRRRLDKHK